MFDVTYEKYIFNDLQSGYLFIAKRHILLLKWYLFSVQISAKQKLLAIFHVSFLSVVTKDT